jgi:hypothetical protein
VAHFEAELNVMYDKLYLKTASRRVKWPKNQALDGGISQLVLRAVQDRFLQLQGGGKFLDSLNQRQGCGRWGCHSFEAVTRSEEGRSRREVDGNEVASLFGKEIQRGRRRSEEGVGMEAFARKEKEELRQLQGKQEGVSS